MYACYNIAVAKEKLKAVIGIKSITNVLLMIIDPVHNKKTRLYQPFIIMCYPFIYIYLFLSKKIKFISFSMNL